jgi:hypothetical protein
MVEPVLRKDIVESVLKEQANLNIKSEDKLSKVMKFMNISKGNNYVNEFPNFDSICNLELVKNREISDYINKLYPNIKFSIYKANNNIATD